MRHLGISELSVHHLKDDDDGDDDGDYGDDDKKELKGKVQRNTSRAIKRSMSKNSKTT